MAEMTGFAHNPYGAYVITPVASSSNFSGSDTDSNPALSDSSFSSVEADIGYVSDPPAPQVENRRSGEVEVAGRKPMVAIPHSFLVTEESTKEGNFLENLVKNSQPLSAGERMIVRSSPAAILKYCSLMAAKSFNNEVYDEDAKNLLEFVNPAGDESDNRLVARLVDMMVPYADSCWRKLEVSNYLVHFLFFLGQYDATLPLQLALLPHLVEMMNHPHGNTAARGLLLHGHPALVPMVRKVIQQPSTQRLLQSSEKYAFYVLRWYHQANRSWMEANCPALARTISDMSRTAQSSNRRN